MTKKGTDIISYLTIIGWLLAYFCGTRHESAFHINQSMLLILANIIWGIAAKVLVFIPIVGWIAIVVIQLVIFVFWVMGIWSAIQGTEKPIPIIGGIKIFE